MGSPSELRKPHRRPLLEVHPVPRRVSEVSLVGAKNPAILDAIREASDRACGRLPLCACFFFGRTERGARGVTVEARHANLPDTSPTFFC